MTVYTTLVGSSAHSTKQHAIKLQEINLDFQNLKETVENLDVEALAQIKQEFEGLNLTDLVTEQELSTALSNHPTLEDVNLLLNNYATDAELSDYAMNEEVSNLLINYPTQEMVNSALENYVLNGDWNICQPHYHQSMKILEH